MMREDLMNKLAAQDLNSWKRW